MSKLYLVGITPAQGLCVSMQTQSLCVRGSRSFEMFRCFAKDYVAESVKITEWLQSIQRFKIETEFHIDSRHSFVLFMAAVCLLPLYNTSHLKIFHQPLIIVFWQLCFETMLPASQYLTWALWFCTNMCVFLVIISLFLHVYLAAHVSPCSVYLVPPFKCIHLKARYVLV